MSFRHLRGALVSTVVALAVAQPLMLPIHVAHADQGSLDAASARELFREALASEAGGDYATALAKLQQVASFKNTPQVRFNIAVCQEKLGRLVVALGEYRIALADAEQDPGAKKVVSEARDAIEAIEPRIPTITLESGAGSETATITMDGKAVGATALGKPILADPGTRVVEASAPGYKKFRREVTLEEGAKVTVEVALKKTPPTVVDTAPEPETAPASKERVPESTTSSATATLGWLSLGVGVVGGTLAGVFYAKRSSVLSQLDEQCTPNADTGRSTCPKSAASLRDDGQTYTTLGNVGLVIGIVGVGTGIVLLATSGKPSAAPAEPPKRETTVRLVPSSSGAWAGASLVGTF